ncbi:cytochrome P450 9e2-like [Bradysia coprophila]|uniref:cytochrome P450 9e2-like n=1 Tax=Bradysia coprophila TaxID=38358 RepID=UPI00187DAB2A|nr:cytochrome P450 9e2-like [Bradysia coprophila]
MFLWIVLVLLYLLYKWSTASHDYFRKRGIQFEEPLPLAGNLLNMVLGRESIVDITKRSYYNFEGSKIFGFFNFNQKVYILTDPEIIKRITIQDFDHFVNHDAMLSNLDRLFGKTLFGMQGQQWKDMRATLSPMFTSSKLKSIFGLLSNHAQDFVQHFEVKAGSDGKNDIDVLEIFARFTADGIATAVLGFEGDCVKNEKSFLYQKVRDILRDFGGPVGGLKFILGNTFPKLYKALNIQLTSDRTVEFFKRVIIDVMKERGREKITRPDIIQLMMQVKNGQLQSNENEGANDKDLGGFAAHEEHSLKSNVKNLQEIVDDDEYWIAQGVLFFVAGFDTSSNLLQSITYNLAMNPAIQEELYREVNEVACTLSGKQVTYEALHKMKFLDMVVCEGLRIQPPAPQIDRCCSKDYTMDLGSGKSIEIKKDEVIFLPFYLLHHDSKYFPNPEKFDPYRFSDENRNSIVTGSYLPFGLGPRACIGSRFALMEAKLLLFNVLANFKIVPSPKTPAKLTFSSNFNMRIKETVYLNFERRC